jgi:hypothetical protein
MDKVECKLRVINKSSSNYSIDWHYFDENERNISYQNYLIKEYFNVWNEHQSNQSNYLNFLNEFQLLDRINYQEICGPKVIGVDSVMLKFMNIDSLFIHYQNKLPIDSFKCYKNIWYKKAELEKMILKLTLKISN